MLNNVCEGFSKRVLDFYVILLFLFMILLDYVECPLHRSINCDYRNEKILE